MSYDVTSAAVCHHVWLTHTQPADRVTTQAEQTIARLLLHASPDSRATATTAASRACAQQLYVHAHKQLVNSFVLDHMFLLLSLHAATSECYTRRHAADDSGAA